MSMEKLRNIIFSVLAENVIPAHGYLVTLDVGLKLVLLCTDANTDCYFIDIAIFSSTSTEADTVIGLKEEFLAFSQIDVVKM